MVILGSGLLVGAGDSGGTPIPTDPYSTPTDPYFSDVVLLMHLNGADGSTVFADVKGNTINTYGNSRISTNNSKWGGSSLYLDGINSALSINRAAIDLRSSVNPLWTIECWMYPIIQTGRKTIFTNYNINGNGQSNSLLLSTTQIGTDGITFGYTLPTGRWLHWASTKSSSGLITLYLDGAFIQSTTANPTNSSPNNYLGGCPGDNNIGNEYFNGYINDFRITLNNRYPVPFTPPSTQFSNQ
ncbi:MAG: LamG-like jellyroll fold domain-containing protein [Nostoc sp.]